MRVNDERSCGGVSLESEAEFEGALERFSEFSRPLVSESVRRQGEDHGRNRT